MIQYLPSRTKKAHINVKDFQNSMYKITQDTTLLFIFKYKQKLDYSKNTQGKLGHKKSKQI